MKTTIESNINELAQKLKAKPAKIKKGMNEGLNETSNIAVRQMKALHQPHSKTGKLLTNIKSVRTSEYTRTIGSFLNEKYPLYVEKGRGPVFAKRARALHFFVGGKEVFTKRVGPAAPRPFVKPTKQSIETLFPLIMKKHVSKAIHP